MEDLSLPCHGELLNPLALSCCDSTCHEGSLCPFSSKASSWLIKKEPPGREMAQDREGAGAWCDKEKARGHCEGHSTIHTISVGCEGLA